MRTFRYTFYALALTLMLMWPATSSAQLYHYHNYARSRMVAPGASFLPTSASLLNAGYVAQPYYARSTAFGPYYGRTTGSFYTGDTYRYVPVVTPGTSFVYQNPYAYANPALYSTGLTNAISPATGLPVTSIAPVGYVSPTIYSPGVSLRTRPAFRPVVSTGKPHIPGLKNYQPGIQLVSPGR